MNDDFKSRSGFTPGLMPCGGLPVFDKDSGNVYKCSECGCVIGSLTMPAKCRKMLDEAVSKEKLWDGLKNYGR